MTGLLRNRSLLSVVGLVAVLAICVSYLFASVLDTSLTHRPPEVTVRLTTTGGLFEGSPATYRGVRVGTVTGIDIARGGGVEATVELWDEVRVPRKTRAEVRSLSPVGEQFLDFQPGRAEGPWLADGDEVEATATETPVAVAAAADELTGLLDRVDRRDLRVVLRELRLATEGTGGDLDRLLVSSDRLVSALDETWPQTDRLLRNGVTVGELLASHERDLVGLSGSARPLARWLRNYDPEFRRILRAAPADFDTVGLLVGDLETVLPPFLRTLVSLTDLAYDREAHLRALTAALPYGQRQFASAFGGGWLHVDLNIQGQEHCEYGTSHSDPTSADRRPLERSGRCAGRNDHWRGAEHAPPPLER
jgi:virulence factor Mce-like protein